MEKKSAGRSIIKGTMILIAGNIIVKIIGALFKLPLANIIGADGMGLYNSSFIVYDIFLVLSTAGFPLAVSKMVAASSARGNAAQALKIFKVSRNCFFFIGLTFSLIMFFGARLFSNLIGNSRACLSVMVLAPAVLFVSLMSAYRGYYQGTNDMIPTTVSQVIEAVCRLIVGLSLSWCLKSAGYRMEVVAAGSLVGITVGEFSSTFGLAMIHRHRMKKQKISKKCKTPGIHIISKMFSTSAPIATGTIIISVINMLDNSVVMHRLEYIGYTERQANTLYGTYNMAFTIFALPLTIVSALVTSVFPILTYSFACNQYRRVSRVANASLRVAMLAAMASAGFFATLSYPILILMYFKQPQAARAAAPILTMLAPSAVAMSLSMITATILQAVDKLMAPTKAMIVGGTVCLLSNWILVGNPKIGIYGAPVGILLCYTITSMLNIHEIVKYGKISISFNKLFLKPFIPAACMAVAGAAFFRITAVSIGILKAAVISILASMFVYIIVLFSSHAVEREDLLALPKGKKLVRFLEHLHLMPD